MATDERAFRRRIEQDEWVEGIGLDDEEIASMIDETTDLSEKADWIASTNDTQRERIEGITAAVEALRDAEERNDGGTKPNT